MTYPLAVVLANLATAQWWMMMFKSLHHFMYNLTWSGFLLELTLAMCTEYKFRMTTHLVMWVCNVEIPPVKKQCFWTTPADL